MSTRPTTRVVQAPDDFRIEIPSWGFANTGMRFGKFLQAADDVFVEQRIDIIR